MRGVALALTPQPLARLPTLGEGEFLRVDVIELPTFSRCPLISVSYVGLITHHTYPAKSGSSRLVLPQNLATLPPTSHSAMESLVSVRAGSFGWFGGR